MTAKIVVVGSFNMDLTTYMKRLPRPGETVNGKQFMTGAGGKGSNQAVAAARLGADVTFIGRVGQDSFGNEALRTWEEEGITTNYVIRDPDKATGVAPILVDESGENMIVVALGANLALSSEDIDAAAEAIARADVLLTQLEIQHATAAYALQVARSQNVTTILNPAPAVKLMPDIVRLVDYLTPNETELEILGDPDDSIEDAARALIANDSQTVVVTLGSKGAQWIKEEDSAIVSTYPVDVVDTTGAGDAFNAGLAVALAEERPLPDAIAFANAVASLCVTRKGTARSMPHRADVDALLEQHR